MIATLLNICASAGALMTMSVPDTTYDWMSGHNQQFNNYVELNSRVWTYPEYTNTSFWSVNGNTDPHEVLVVSDWPFFNCTAPIDNANYMNGPDIRNFTAVAALGDSLTAAFGAEATSIFNLFTDYRDVSWSGGGVKHFTLPNVLKTLYNPNIKGYAVGSGDAESYNAQFNDAITGGTVLTLTQEINILADKIARDNTIAKDGWLMVTLMIGANDLCAEHSPDLYYRDIEQNIELIHQLFMINGIGNFTGVYINLVSPPNVVEISKLDSFWCNALHLYECPAALNNPPKIEKLHKEYQIMLKRIESHYNNRYNNFYVINQPFLQSTHLPIIDGKPDLSYWSIDCFHFSKKAHEAAALALFNNLFEPIGNKTERWIPHEQIECPKSVYLPI